MSTHQEILYCSQCRKNTLHLVPDTSHLLHLVLSVLTAGLWLFVWAAISLRNYLSSDCTVCGRWTRWGQH